MNKKATWLVVMVLLMIGLTAASVFGWRKYQEAKIVADAKEMQAKLFDEKTSAEERSKIVEKMRGSRDTMSDAQRRAFGDQMRQGFQRKMEERINAFFAMSDDEKTAHLDEEIDRMEERRKEWEQRRAEREKERGEGNEERAGRGGEGGKGGREGRRGGTDEDRSKRRDEFRRKISDKTTPEQRAKFQAYREAMQERREERGLPAGGGWGRPDGGRPGGGRPGK
jgi:hypothetical protein